MRLGDQRQSTNIDDRRGRRVGGPVGLGGGGLGMILVVLLISWLTGTNPLSLLQVTGGLTPGGTEAGPPPVDDGQSTFIKQILGDLEETWGEIFAQAGERYSPPVLVLFEDTVQSACGSASAATGPFYCPADRKVYLDLSFFRELDERFGAPGDFAQAYVVAHEVGHHIQNELGVNAEVSRLQQRSSEVEANGLSVRMELQADCYAGVWGNHAARQEMLDAGDVDEGLRAAAAIGDDRLQREARGRVAPESFTHGTSAQRAHWLRTGLSSGRIEDCDTFRAGAP
ncbi:MAG: zinc metallopeptidase [Acidobacteriota bacterium]|nr:zinc metallopeptidase [Acidobacteriota bacterium]